MENGTVREGEWSYLVEELADVGLRLAEPHGEQLGALDRDEVGLAEQSREHSP